MSFPRYPKYKDSGVEWLGEVPEHWGCTALKRFVDHSRPITYGIVQAGPDIVGGVPYIRPADMADEQGVNSPDGLLRTSKEIATAYTRSTIQSGDLVCSIGPSFGKVMVTPDWLAGANLTQGTARVAVGKGQHARFVFWALRSGVSTAQWESSVGGATFRALNLGPLAETILPAPSLPEQTAIAAFLDHETAKIDALIAEQQRLIALLQEKRQAVISHAVTKGLNPDAPMKDSGIEWLGEVPEHWRVMTVRRLLGRVEQGWSPECFSHPAEIDEWGVVKAGCVNRGVFNEEDNKALPGALAPLPQYEIRVGDLLMSRASGSPELVGSTAYVEQVRPRLMLSDKIFRLHTTSLVTRRYFALLLNAPIMRLQIERAISGADGLANNLPQAALRSFFCVVPPVEEQHAIVSYVCSRLVELSQLSNETQQTIALLQERRSALISAAVTGQIDVRGLTGSEAA